MSPWLVAILLLVGLYLIFKANAGSKKSKNTAIPNHQDAYEGSFWEISRLYSSNSIIEVDYCDAVGNATRRVVQVASFGKEGDRGYFTGFCQLRGEPRTFRFDRVRAAVDTKTGEEIANLYDHLFREYESSPLKSADILQTENADILRVLFYVGKADGRLLAAERAVILNTCHHLTGDRRIDDALLQSILQTMDKPSFDAFSAAVSRLKSKPAETRCLIIDAAERIVGTQKTVHADEKAAIEHLSAHLSTAS